MLSKVSRNILQSVFETKRPNAKLPLITSSQWNMFHALHWRKLVLKPPLWTSVQLLLPWFCHAELFSRYVGRWIFYAGHASNHTAGTYFFSDNEKNFCFNFRFFLFSFKFFPVSTIFQRGTRIKFWVFSNCFFYFNVVFFKVATKVIYRK